ncbi:MAG: DUF2177 family protein, partial [Novosphingobium sp.]|nr:DUF2177 family protein [Novosphingobium sp.]
LLYRPALGDLLAENFRWGPAIAFYIIFIAGLTAFAVVPGLLSVPYEITNPWLFGVRGSMLLGMGFGLVCYATYDLTNQATLKVWPVHVTLIDLAWGTVASGFAAGMATFVVSKFSPGLGG